MEYTEIIQRLRVLSIADVQQSLESLKLKDKLAYEGFIQVIEKAEEIKAKKNP